MAVEAEDLGFENMGFVPFDMFGSQDWVLSDGVCLQETEHFVQQINYSDNFVLSSIDSLQLEFLRSLYSDLERQRLEMAGFFQLEGQIMRRSIMQEQMHQTAILMQKLESKTKSFMLSKDEELVTARNRTTELQALLKSAEFKAKVWEKKALENEATVFNLNNRLINAAEHDDAVSFCDSSSSRKDEIKAEEQSKKMSCKLCKVQNMCVVFLPCRHLCCCKCCEPLLGQCRVCGTPKVATLEVFLV